MKKIAFINGRHPNPATGKMEIMNFVLANGKVVGVGYLPDEEEAGVEVIDISNLHVICTQPARGISLLSVPTFTVIDPKNDVVRYTVVRGELK